jgi:hypothetical protein
LAQFERTLDERLLPAPPADVPLDMFNEYSKHVSDILRAWGAKFNSISFNLFFYDIEIDGAKRGLSGKGYRAVYFAAFMVGLIQHCIKNRLEHPRFLLLDSPLLNLKETDALISSGRSSEILPDSIKDSFYESLSNLDYLQRIQIIIMENRPPTPEVSKRINHIHFTKDREHGRYGFFP